MREIARERRQALETILRPTKLDRYVATFHEPGFPEALPECRQCDPPCRTRIEGTAVKIPNHRHRLRPRCERACRRRAAEQRDDLASPHHSITSSARASNVGGTCRRSALAVVRLMTRSNLVGCSTGTSAGLAPRRILSTYSAARHAKCVALGP